MSSSSLGRIAWTSVPVSLATTLGWFGIFTFVNGYLVNILHYTNEEWTRATLWFTGTMVVMPFAGVWLASHVGRRHAIALAMAACAASYAGFAVARRPVVVSLLFVLAATVQSTISAVWLATVAAAGGERPGRALAVFFFVMTVVGAAVLAAGGHLMAGVGYRAGFALCAAVSVLCGFAFLTLSKGLGDAGKVKSVSPWRLSRADLRDLATGPFLAVLLLGILFEPFNYHTSNQLYPNLARDIFGMAEADISTVVALGRIPALLTLLLMARLIDRVNPVRCYGLGIALVGGCVALMGQAPCRAAAIAAYAAYYLGYGGIWGSCSAAVNVSVARRVRDVSFAVMTSASVAAVFIVGIVHNRMLAGGWSLRGLFTCCGSMAAAGDLLIASTFLWRTAEGRTSAIRSRP